MFFCKGNASLPDSLGESAIQFFLPGLTLPPPPSLPHKVCDHREVFRGNVGLDVAVMVALPLFLALASAAGIGGGGIVVPLLLLLAQLPAYYPR